MKKLILLMTVILGLGYVASANAETPALDARSTSVVLFYADWCGSCKILEPKLKKAMSNVQSSKIKLVVLDMTDDATKAKSADLAAKKGLTDIYQSYAPKTGMAILADGRGKEVGKLKKNQSVGDMTAALQSLNGDQL